MTKILSRQNPKIKIARALSRISRSAPKHLMLVEGIRHVGEAVESDWTIDFILHSPALLSSEFARKMLIELPENIDVFEVSEDILESIANKKNPQGILAVVEKPVLGLDAAAENGWRFLVGLQEPQDPGNVGTILRTMDAAGAEALVIIGGGVNPWHPKAIRASMGAHFSIPIVQVSQEEFLAWNDSQELMLMGTSAKAEDDYRVLSKVSLPLMLLLGSERKGLSAELQAACKQFVTIPMRGKSTSLNLAVSAGILLYQISNEVYSSI